MLLSSQQSDHNTYQEFLNYTSFSGPVGKNVHKIKICFNKCCLIVICSVICFLSFYNVLEFLNYGIFETNTL